MQSLLKNKAFFCSLVLCFSIPQISAHDSQEVQEQPNELSEAQVREKIQDELEQVQRHTLKSLSALEETFQEWILELNAGAIKTSDESGLKNAITFHRKLVQEYHAALTGMTVIDLEKLDKTLVFIDQIVDHLLALVKKGLRNFIPFNDKQVRSSKNLEDITLEELHNRCKENESKVQELKDRSTNLALSWYNKAFRKLAKVWDRYKGASVAKYTTACSALAGYLWFKSESENPTMRTWLGWSRKQQEDLFANIREYKEGYHDFSKDDIANMSDRDLRHLINDDRPLGKLGIVDDWVINFNQGKLPIARWLLSYFLFSETQQHYSSIRQYFGQKREAVTNWFKGGVYKQNQTTKSYEFTSEITFDDVIGYDNIKQELRMRILKFIEDPERFIRQGIPPEKGWLFTGPTRTGKSFMMKALCGEITQLLESLGRKKEFKFFSFTASEIMNHGIKLIVQVMKQHAPCVVFIDEIDLLNLQRVGNSTLLSEFLTTMSGFMQDDPEKLVILIGATNKPETLDNSLRQHGRFGKEIRFEKPSFTHRKEYLLRRLSKLAIDTAQLDLDKLALETYGHVYEDIEAMIKVALQEAKAKGLVIDQLLLEDAFNTEVRRINKAQPISPLEKEIVAMHQMGTALAHFLLGSRDLVSLVTANPITAKLQEEMHYQSYDRPEEFKQKETIHGNVFTFRLEESIGIETTRDKIAQCKILLAGNIAEKVMRNTCSYSYRPEKKYDAFYLAKELACEGIHPSQLSDELKDKATAQAWNMIKEYEQELTELFEEHKPYLTLLTMLLFDHDVTGEDIVHILNRDKKEIEDILTEANNLSAQDAAQEQSPASVTGDAVA